VRNVPIGILLLVVLTGVYSCVPVKEVPPDVADAAPAASRAVAEAEEPSLARRVLELNRRALELARAGRYAECAPLLEEAVELDPGNYVAWYNLGCVRCRLGELDAALECVRTALARGYSDFRHMERDSDLEALRKLPGYQDLLARNVEIQRTRAERIRAALRNRFGEDYICEIDHAARLVFATNTDRRTLEALKGRLTEFAEALWNDLFTHRFEQYVTIVIPSSGGKDVDWKKGGGYYRHSQRLLVAKQIGMVLMHEFTHALHDADQGGLGQAHPVWIREGLATLFESSRVEDGHVVPVDNHRLNVLLSLLARRKAMSLKHLFNHKHGHFMRHSLVCYPQSRYVMMYLWEKGLLKKWYDAYTAGFTRDRSGTKAMEQVFGKPLKQIESEWRRWVRRRRPPPARLRADGACMGIVMAGETEGVRVWQVMPGGGAERAGLKPGDLIVSIDGESLVEGEALLRLLCSREAGDELIVRFRRNRQYRTVTVKLGSVSECYPAGEGPVRGGEPGRRKVVPASGPVKKAA